MEVESKQQAVKPRTALLEAFVAASPVLSDQAILVKIGKEEVALTPAAAAKLSDQLLDSLAMHYRRCVATDRLVGSAGVGFVE